MHKLIVILVTLLISVSFSTLGRDLESEEIELREKPQKMYDSLNKSVSFPVDVKNRQQFERSAKEQGYNPDEFEHILQLLARLNMEPNIKSKLGFQDANTIIELLTRIAQSPYEQAMVSMLRGRYVGRVEQKYQQAISFYNEALTRINDSFDIEAMLLKHTIHEHLGGLYLVIRQDSPALIHFQTSRDIAYKLRNDYLIAAAESKLGHYYNKNKQLTKSLQHYSEAMRLSNRSNYPSMKTHLQLQLAKVYRDLKQWDEALKNAYEAADDFKKLGNDTYLSSCMTVIAMVYGEQGDWNKAIDYYLNAQQLDAKRGNYIAQGLNFHNLGQAYSNIDDNVTSLKYLLMANQIFKEKQSHHYLVYNELLIGEIAQAKEDWPLMISHANNALALANELKLTDEQKSALTQIALAAEKLGDTSQTIATQKRIIELEQQTHTPEKNSAILDSALTEHQLNLKLSMLQGKLDDMIQAAKTTNTLLALSGLIATILMIVSIILFNHHRKIHAQNQALMQLSQQEPFTHHLGYAALLGDLGEGGATRLPTFALGLVEFQDYRDSDISHGQYFANAIMTQFAELISETFAMPVYVIRQGVLAVRFTENITPQHVITRMRQQLDERQLTQTFNLGFIHLPLIAKSEMKMDPKLQFETVQMALAGARSLPANKDHFVTLRALDFAPSNLFANPLFLHLEKGIERGLIRVETNANKEEIHWPCWEKNQDRLLLKNI